jgi:hypothetical protein
MLKHKIQNKNGYRFGIIMSIIDDYELWVHKIEKIQIYCLF